MVLRCDVAAACFGVCAGLVLAAMAVFELVSFCAGSQGHDLCAEANSAGWDFFLEAGFHDFYRFRDEFWVAGAV